MKRKAIDDGSKDPVLKRVKEEVFSEDASTVEDSSSRVNSDDDTSTIQFNSSIPPTAPTDNAESEYTASGRRKFPSELKTIPCTVAGCTKKFNRPARLVAHLRSHNNERPYKCTHEGCDKTYTDNKHLRSHVLSAHTQDPAAAFKFACDVCAARFATGQRLKRHALTHQDAAAAERFRCRDYPPCTQSFRKHQTLLRHVRKDHLGQKPFQCSHAGCSEAYDTANALKAHANRVHGEPRFWCDECTKDEPGRQVGFTTIFLLEQHIRQEHVNCIFCDGLKFGGQYELEKHMEVYHSGLTVKDRKNVPCDFPGCDKRFVKKSNMKAHYRSAHEGVRVVCGQLNTWDSPGLEDWNWMEEGCGQSFTNKAALEHHVRHVHLGKKRPHYDGPTATSTPEPGVLDELSGVTDYERRTLECPHFGCTARFIRHADLHEHVRAMHEIQQQQQQQQIDDWENNESAELNTEDADVMQLLNLDGVIDPALLLVEA